MHLSLAPLRRVLLSRPFNTAAARAVHVSAQQNKKQTAPLPSAAESLALESLAKKDSTQKKDKSAVEEPRNTDRTMQPLSQVFPILFLMFVFQLSCLCLLSAYFCLFLISSGHPIKANVRIQGSANSSTRSARANDLCPDGLFQHDHIYYDPFAPLRLLKEKGASFVEGSCVLSH